MHISSGAKQILETRCIKQHAFLVDPLGVSHDFSNAHTLKFFHPETRGSKSEKVAWKFRSPKPPRCPIPTEKGARKEGHSGFRVANRDQCYPHTLCGRKGAQFAATLQAGTLVYSCASSKDTRSKSSSGSRMGET